MVIVSRLSKALKAKSNLSAAGKHGHFQALKPASSSQHLTGNVEGRILAAGCAQVVRGYTGVHPFVGLALPLVEAEEEERPIGQKGALGINVVFARFHILPIAVPLNRGCRTPCHTAVQGGRLVPTHHQVRWVINDVGRELLRMGL